VHGGDVWRYGHGILDFSANINPLGPPAGVREALLKSLDEVIFYPEPHARTLRAALAAAYGVAPQEVIVGNGAAELIFLYCRARQGLHAVAPVPTFSEYDLACRAAGGRFHTYPLAEKDAFQISVDDFLDWFHRWRGVAAGSGGIEGAPTVFLCSPNNPTGQLLSREVLEALQAGLAATGASLFLDLSFLGFVPGQCLANAALPLVPLTDFREIIRQEGDGQEMGAALPAGLFLLFSFTKLFALPGIRLGFAIGPRTLIAAMERQRDPWTVNTPAQRAGCRCLQEQEYVRQSAELITAAREELVRGLERIGGITVFPGTANFLLCHLRQRRVRAAALAAALAAEGILIRNASDFAGLDPYYFRLAVRHPAANAQLLEKLHNFGTNNFGTQ